MYKPVHKDSFDVFKSKFTKLIAKAYNTGTIDKETNEYLTVKHPKVPVFYSLLKIHKNTTDPLGVQSSWELEYTPNPPVSLLIYF